MKHISELGQAYLDYHAKEQKDVLDYLLSGDFEQESQNIKNSQAEVVEEEDQQE